MQPSLFGQDGPPYGFGDICVGFFIVLFLDRPGILFKPGCEGDVFYLKDVVFVFVSLLSPPKLARKIDLPGFFL